MDFALEITGFDASMTFDKAEDGNLATNIYVSLMIPKGGWWFNPAFGSRLHLLKRAKNTEQTAGLARDYCKEALQWLLDTGRASAIDIYSERDALIDPHRLQLLVQVTKASGDLISFQTFVEVI